MNSLKKMIFSLIEFLIKIAALSAFAGLSYVVVTKTFSFVVNLF